MAEVIIEGVDLLDKVRKYKARDDEVVKVVEEMKQAGIKMLRDEEWCQEDGLYNDLSLDCVILISIAL